MGPQGKGLHLSMSRQTQNLMTWSPNVGFHWCFKDLKGTLAQELDFENEAKNSERCAEELKHFNFVVVPKVYWEQTSKVRQMIIFLTKDYLDILNHPYIRLVLHIYLTIVIF